MLVTETWPPIYVGGRTEYSFNVDFDHLSIPELVDIAKEFGVIKLGTTYIASKDGPLKNLTKDGYLLDLGLLLKNGDTIDIYVRSGSVFDKCGQHQQAESASECNTNNEFNKSFIFILF